MNQNTSYENYFYYMLVCAEISLNDCLLGRGLNYMEQLWRPTVKKYIQKYPSWIKIYRSIDCLSRSALVRWKSITCICGMVDWTVQSIEIHSIAIITFKYHGPAFHDKIVWIWVKVVMPLNFLGRVTGGFIREVISVCCPRFSYSNYWINCTRVFKIPVLLVVPNKNDTMAGSGFPGFKSTLFFLPNEYVRRLGYVFLWSKTIECLS